MSEYDALQGIYDRISRVGRLLREEQRTADDRFNMIYKDINEIKATLEQHRQRMGRIEARIRKTQKKVRGMAGGER